VSACFDTWPQIEPSEIIFEVGRPLAPLTRAVEKGHLFAKLHNILETHSPDRVVNGLNISPI
jgi:hypothetical protein